MTDGAATGSTTGAWEATAAATGGACETAGAWTLAADALASGNAEFVLRSGAAFHGRSAPIKYMAAPKTTATATAPKRFQRLLALAALDTGRGCGAVRDSNP